MWGFLLLMVDDQPLALGEPQGLGDLHELLDRDGRPIEAAGAAGRLNGLRRLAITSIEDLASRLDPDFAWLRLVLTSFTPMGRRGERPTPGT
jgi:hypothetical protein